MSDVQALFIFLFLFYLLECFRWISKHTIAFISPWGRRWQVKFSTSLFGNDHGGLLFMNPLPPLGSVFLSHLSPVSISPTGVCAYNLQSLPGTGRPIQSGKFFLFDEITDVSTQGAHLLLNNTKFVKCATAEQAKSISDLIKAAIRLYQAEREVLIRSFIDKQFNKDEASAIFNSAVSYTKTLKIVCSIFFVFLFIIVPILVNIYGLRMLIFPIVVCIGLFAVQISIMFYSAHKVLYPDLKQERIKEVVKMILWPPMSIRAADLLNANLVSKFNPIIVAHLLSGFDTEQFIRMFILDLRYPLRHDLSDQLPIEITTWYVIQQLSCSLEYVNKTENLNQFVLFTPPPNDGSSISYCPRCGCQVNTSSGECPDCPGVELHAYPKSETTENGGKT